MKTLTAYLVVALLSFVLPLLCAAQSPLRSGPMVGHVDMRGAKIFVQTWSESDVRITYRDNIVGKGLSTPTRRTRAEDANCITFELDSVEPGRTYTYNVIVNNEAVTLNVPTSFTTPPIWKHRGNNLPTFSIAFGSCHYVNEAGYERFDSNGVEAGYGSNYQIFDAIVKAKPNAMVWLGDNVYLREPDWNSRAGILKRYSHTRALPQSAALFASVANYATWDDHDYGPNDSDRGWWGKHLTLEAFKLFWPNPSYGVMERPGVTTTFELIDAQVFLLDDRYYRSADQRKDGDRTILGEHQIKWLIDALASSTATFKIVAVGSQFLTDNPRKECFFRMPQERQLILDMLALNKIPGVIFLSGDIHSGELSMLNRRDTYPLYEVTSSPLTAGTYKKYAGEPNTFRVPGTAVGEHNFGLLTIRGVKGARVLTIQLMNKDGNELWKHEVSESQLR